MARKKKRYNRFNLPPCPDPARYMLAEDKDGYYWRLRRGCGKPAGLNTSLSRNAALTGPTNAGASRILKTLTPFLNGIRNSKLSGCLGGLLKKSINQNGRADFSLFEGFDFQEAHPLEQLLKNPVLTEVQNGMVQLCIVIDETAVKAHNQLVSHFYMEAVLLYGDAMEEHGLAADYRESPLYSFEPFSKGLCRLELELPPEPVPWMLLLKVNCLEGRELAVHPKHYGLKVVKAGSGGGGGGGG
jgi:hypothetical protein